MERDAFQAIADPTRRELIRLLSLSTLNINSLNIHFDISRAAIYKHIKILEDAGLISINVSGRERFCELKSKKLKEVDKWLEPYRKAWDVKDKNTDLVNDTQSKKKKKDKKKKHSK